jgi:hypothetical protein
MIEPTSHNLAAPSTQPSVDARARAIPVLWWAACGAVFLVTSVVVYAKWILSGQAHRIRPAGPDLVPTSDRVWATVLQIVIPVIAIAIIGWVARRVRRGSAGDLDLLMIVGFVSIYWLDPSVSYAKPLVYFNSTLLNLGSWVEHIPGWASPNGHRLPEPLLLVGPSYVLLAGFALLLSAAMGRIEGRWPRLSAPWVVLATVPLAYLGNLAIEIVFVNTGLLAWSGTIPELTVGAGELKQYPLYEPLLFGGIVWVAMGALHHYRDALGLSIVERGTQRLTVRPAIGLTLRVLAVIGYTNLVMAISCTIVGLTALHLGPVPAYQSFMTNGMCGPGTAQAC